MPTVENASIRRKTSNSLLRQKWFCNRVQFICGTAIITLFSPSALAAPAAADCGTVIAEANNDISSFNPLYANDLGNSRAAQLLFQPLVWIEFTLQRMLNLARPRMAENPFPWGR